MLKKILLTVINTILYILCVLFSFSSFFSVISFTPVKSIVFNNESVLIGVFILGAIIAVILGHYLNQLFLVLRQPVQEWKKLLLKR